jgi:hypothetical protein
MGMVNMIPLLTVHTNDGRAYQIPLDRFHPSRKDATEHAYRVFGFKNIRATTFVGYYCPPPEFKTAPRRKTVRESLEVASR